MEAQLISSKTREQLVADPTWAVTLVKPPENRAQIRLIVSTPLTWKTLVTLSEKLCVTVRVSLIPMAQLLPSQLLVPVEIKKASLQMPIKVLTVVLRQWLTGLASQAVSRYTYQKRPQQKIFIKKRRNSRKHLLLPFVHLLRRLSWVWMPTQLSHIRRQI